MAWEGGWHGRVGGMEGWVAWEGCWEEGCRHGREEGGLHGRAGLLEAGDEIIAQPLTAKQRWVSVCSQVSLCSPAQPCPALP